MVSHLWYHKNLWYPIYDIHKKLWRYPYIDIYCIPIYGLPFMIYHKNLWYPHLWYPRYVSFIVSPFMVSHLWYHKNLWYPHLWYPRYVSFMVSHLWYPIYDIPINIVKHRKTHWAPNRLIGFYATSRAKMAAKTKSPTLSWRWQMANLWYITCPGMTTAYTCINSFLFICMYIYTYYYRVFICIYI